MATSRYLAIITGRMGNQRPWLNRTRLPLVILASSEYVFGLINTERWPCAALMAYLLPLPTNPYNMPEGARKLLLRHRWRVGQASGKLLHLCIVGMVFQRMFQLQLRILQSP